MCVCVCVCVCPATLYIMAYTFAVSVVTEALKITRYASEIYQYLYYNMSIENPYAMEFVCLRNLDHLNLLITAYSH